MTDYDVSMDVDSQYCSLLIVTVFAHCEVHFQPLLTQRPLSLDLDMWPLIPHHVIHYEPRSRKSQHLKPRTHLDQVILAL